MMLRGTGVSKVLLRGRLSIFSAAATAGQQRELSSTSPTAASVKNVVVIGSGLMGAGIAQVTRMFFLRDVEHFLVRERFYGYVRLRQTGFPY